MSSSRIKPVVPSRTQLESSHATSPPPTTSACAPATTIVESTTFPGTRPPAVATCQPPCPLSKCDTLARSWPTHFPCRLLKMAAVRFTLLVALLLSLMFFATPLNAAAARSLGCFGKWVSCVGFKHEQCNECVEYCTFAAVAATEKYRPGSVLMLKDCKHIQARAGTR